IDYGPIFRGLREVQTGDREALARLELSEPIGEHLLHPALLDAALQAIASLASASSSATYLPVSVARAVLHRPRAGARLWVHVRGDLGDATSETMTAECVLFDDTGSVVAELQGLGIKRATAGALRALAGGATQRLACAVRWQPATPPSVVHDPRVWAVLYDESHAAIVEALASHGLKLVRVRRGAGFVRHGAGEYTADLTTAQGLADLLAGLASADEVPTDFAYLAASGEPGAFTGAHELLHLVQALSAEVRATAPGLRIFTRAALGDRGAPESLAQSMLWGLARVVQREHPELRCRIVDLDAGDQAGDPAAALAVELAVEDVEEQVRWRFGQREVPRLTAVRGEPATPAIVDDATYLITGAFGALGQGVARWLADRGARHLVLVGRREPDGAGARMVTELREAGVDVKTALVDITSATAVDAMIRGLAGEMPPLRGVFHLAAVLADATVRGMTPERLDRVLAPKVLGAWNLHQATRDLGLTAFVMFSSIASLLGAPGQANYAAANAFLDALAHHRRARGEPGLALNWGPWGADDGAAGLARNLGKEDLARWQAAGVEMLGADAGMAWLGEVLDAADPQLMLLLTTRGEVRPPAPVPRLFAAISRSEVQAPTRTAARTLTDQLRAASPELRASMLTRELRRLVGQVLGTDGTAIDPEVSLGEQGMDSLMSLELRNAVAAALGVALPVTLVYEFP
ncbi:MAG TPA: type I polyketide synthase, partial [Nannocystis sp.]